MSTLDILFELGIKPSKSILRDVLQQVFRPGESRFGELSAESFFFELPVIDPFRSTPPPPPQSRWSAQPPYHLSRP